MVAITNVFYGDKTLMLFSSGGVKGSSHRSVGFLSLWGHMVINCHQNILNSSPCISEVTPLGPICPLEFPAEPLVK
jgi:hypothetical protein